MTVAASTAESALNAKPKATFAFAHLSDIHFAGYEPGAMFDVDSELRRDLVIDLERVAPAAGGLDALLLGGDIVGSGTKAEYALATDWIAQLCETFGVEQERVYCVPGNHDVDRSAINDDPVVKSLQKGLLTCPVDDVRPQMEQLISKGEHRDLLFKGLENYNLFAARYRCGFLLENHKWIQTVPLGPVYVQIVGFASSLLSGPSDAPVPEQSQLALGAQGTVEQAFDTFTIVLCHHPPGWLRDREHVEPYLRRGHLQLYGHEHSFDVLDSGDGLRINAGAVHPERGNANWEPSYNVIKLTVEPEHTSQVTVELYARKLQGEDMTFGPARDPEVFRKTITIRRKDETGEGEPAHGTQDFAEPVEELLEPPALTPVQERTVALAFVELPRERRRQIGAALELIDPDDAALPEGERLGRIFERARDRGLLDQLKERIEE